MDLPYCSAPSTAGAPNDYALVLVMNRYRLLSRKWKPRPLGIPILTDRIVQRAMLMAM